MVAVKEITWEEAMSPEFEHPARRAWRDAVSEIAAKAKETLPECNGRVESAVKIVLAGDVELLPDGKAHVASQSNGTTQYFVVNGECSCKDFPTAPSGWCKHRIAAGMQKRAQALAKAKLDGLNSTLNGIAQPASTGNGPLPTTQPAAQPTPVETPHSVPAQHLVMIQGKPFVKFAGLLQMAHARGLVTLTAAWSYNDAELSLAHAVAIFQDGRRFEESGDASPANTGRQVAVHFRRVALTRAKARALRDALGVDLVAVEELSDGE